MTTKGFKKCIYFCIFFYSHKSVMWLLKVKTTGEATKALMRECWHHNNQESAVRFIDERPSNINARVGQLLLCWVQLVLLRSECGPECLAREVHYLKQEL
jgi:hypothetical protein